MGDFRDINIPAKLSDISVQKYYLVDSRMKLTGLTRLPAFEHLEVQVRAGRAAGFAHQGNGLTFLDLVANGNQVFRVVRVARRIAIAVIDLDHDAVAVAISGPGNDTIGDRHNLGATLAGKVDARVIGRLAGERVGALAKVR